MDGDFLQQYNTGGTIWRFSIYSNSILHPDDEAFLMKHHRVMLTIIIAASCDDPKVEENLQ